MKRVVANLSPQAEIAIVLLCAFGIPLAYVVSMALGVLEPQIVTNARMLELLAFELVVLSALGVLLWVRGWTFERLGLGRPVIQDVIDGAGLVVVAYLIPAGILLFLPPEVKQSATNALSFTPLSLPLVVLTSVVNALFEEIFVVGYVFAVLSSGGANRAMAINVSVALRLAYHLSQGPAAVIFILPMAVVFAWWYSTRPSLWPLLFAHAALDLIGLARHVG